MINISVDSSNGLIGPVGRGEVVGGVDEYNLSNNNMVITTI